MPQICYFCGEGIIKKRGQDRDCLCFHSVDGDHDNWAPSNKVPAHQGCHNSYHKEGDKNPAKRPDVRRKLSNSLKGKNVGDKNPSKRPEVKKKISEALKGREFSDETRRRMSEAAKGRKPSDETKKKMSDAHKGKKISEEQKRKISDTLTGKPKPWLRGDKNPMKNPDVPKKVWKTRRERYGPSGCKPKDDENK